MSFVFYFLSYSEDNMFIDFRETGGGGEREMQKQTERERETDRQTDRHQCERETWIGCLPHMPQPGPGVEPETPWCLERCFNQLSNLARPCHLS